MTRRARLVQAGTPRPSRTDSRASAYDVVLLTNGAGQLGGAERSIGELAVQVRAQGLRVIMLADRVLDGTPYAAILAAGDVPVEWVEWHPTRSHYQNVREMWHVFHTYRAPIIQLNVSWRPRLWVVPLVARLAAPRARLIGRVCAMPDPALLVPRRRFLGFIPGLRLWTLMAKFYSLVWRLTAARVVSVNRDEFPRRMVGEYWFRRSSIRVIRNGIPPRSEALSAERRRAYRERARTGAEEVLVLYAGRLDAGKGIEHLLEAVSRLPEKYRLAVLGEGGLAAELREVSAKLGIDSRVTFLGFQPDPRDWMAACDIAVAPSTGGEGLNRTVLEALAERAPIIASSVSGVREIFEDHVHGLFFRPGDVAGLRQAILTMGEDPGLRRRLAEAGYGLYQTEYHVDRVRDQYLALYAEVLGDRAFPTAIL